MSSLHLISGTLLVWLVCRGISWPSAPFFNPPCRPIDVHVLYVLFCLVSKWAYASHDSQHSISQLLWPTRSEDQLQSDSTWRRRCKANIIDRATVTTSFLRTHCALENSGRHLGRPGVSEAQMEQSPH